MKTKTLAICIAIAAFALLFSVMSGFSQEDITVVEDSAFQSHMRPPAQFAHDEHNEIAGVEECNICHHVYEDGKRLEYDSSEGMECSECHILEGSNPIPLATVYHKQCRGCHLEQSAGPVMCGECHVK
jgi:hypothetical protein